MEFINKVNEILKDQVVGAQVYVYSKGETVQLNYGHRSLEQNKLVEDDTIFRIASISKIIVAMAALKLMEEGKLDIEEDISNIFGFPIRNPKFPDKIITTKMLMLHTSSITDGYDDENPEYDNIEKGYNGVNGKKYNVDLEDLLYNTDSKFYSKNTYSNYIPGSKFIYSNFGTGILACVVEKCSGRYFVDYVMQEFFLPLGLDASFRADRIIKKDKISDTFYVDRKTKEFKIMRTAKSFVENAYNYYELGNNFRGPAGGLFISMQDLSKIMLVLMNDGMYEDIKILNKDTVDYMLEMHYLGPDQDYLAKGLQLKFIDFYNKLLKGHTGSAYGVSSYMFFNKEANTGICFIANGGRYKDDLPGLNNIQAGVLKSFVEEFLNEKNMITVKYNLKDDFAYLNNRKITFRNIKVKGDSILLSPIDAANMLNIIPKLIEEKVFIKDNIILFKDEVRLRQLLNELCINYSFQNNEFIINLKN